MQPSHKVKACLIVGMTVVATFANESAASASYWAAYPGGGCARALAAVNSPMGPTTNNNLGEVYAIGCNLVDGYGNYGIFVGDQSGWLPQLPGGAVKIAAVHTNWSDFSSGASNLTNLMIGVDLAVINSGGTQYYWDYGNWSFDPFQNPICATSIDIWSHNAVQSIGQYGFEGIADQFITGCGSPDNTIFTRHQNLGQCDSPSTTWSQFQPYGGATRVAISNNQYLQNQDMWARTSNGGIWHFDGVNWNQINGCATDLAVGYSKVWVLGCEALPHAYEWNGAGWTDYGEVDTVTVNWQTGLIVHNPAIGISVGKFDDVPWITTGVNNGIYFLHP